MSQDETPDLDARVTALEGRLARASLSLHHAWGCVVALLAAFGMMQLTGSKMAEDVFLAAALFMVLVHGRALRHGAPQSAEKESSRGTP